jgi:1-pyrroline-5-carboxylate dehydrogenase
MNPVELSQSSPAKVQNLVGGKWLDTERTNTIVDPLNGEPFMTVPDTNGKELAAFVQSAKEVPKYGVHNPLKNPERYVQWGEICHKAGHELSKPEVLDFFAHTIARVMPKSYYQAWYETKVTADFLKNFAGDNARFNAGGFNVPGDHTGQVSTNYRWPYGAVAIVAPFNFPLEIPLLQLVGALIMGNKPVLKIASNVALVMDQMIRLLQHCGMPMTDMDFINSSGPTMGSLIQQANYRTIQFTGSCEVAELLSKETHGKVKIEDAGFDWKILGPDVSDIEYVAWQSDQDAYACSGQKCSAQSILFMHENWEQAGLIDKIKTLAERRQLSDLTIGPVLTHTTAEILEHTEKLLAIPGAQLLFGGKEWQDGDHTVPAQYGMVQPTAVHVPIEQLMSEEYFGMCCKEIFGPFQVVTTYEDSETQVVLDACERMSHHLTAAVVSNDVRFQTKVLGATVNGTTYVGIRARTTGAPQNHWFGPAGDPRGAGIGSPYAIQLVWTCHREVIHDVGEIPDSWTTPASS